MPVLDIEVAADADDCQVADDGTGFVSSQGSGAGRFVVALSGATAAARRNAGLRFLAVAVPAGATINSAKLQLQVESTLRDDPDLDIWGVDEDDAAAFNGTTRRPTDADLALTLASTSWAQTGTGVGLIDSPSIAAIVQEIVDRVGWVSGNDMAFVLIGKTNANNRDVSTLVHESGTGTYAHLVIDYTPASSSEQRTVTDVKANLLRRNSRTVGNIKANLTGAGGTLDLEIASDADDVMVRADGTTFASAEGAGASQFVTALSNTVDATRRNMGLRFTGVTIPQGATILSAKVQLQVANTTRDDADLDIVAVDEDNCAVWNGTTRRPIAADLAFTTASVSWAATSIPVGLADSPDITAVIQEVVDRAGWASGNAIGIVLVGKNNANNRDVETLAHESATGTYAHLVIEYELPGDVLVPWPVLQIAEMVS